MRNKLKELKKFHESIMEISYLSTTQNVNLNK